MFGQQSDSPSRESQARPSFVTMLCQAQTLNPDSIVSPNAYKGKVHMHACF